MENILENDIGVEDRLTAEVNALWTENVRVSGQKKATAMELRLLRSKLAEKLYEMKTLLCAPGRAGQWRSWLRGVGVPRSSADRLAARHAEMLGIPTENVLNEASSPEQQVEALVKSVLPRLRRALVNPRMAYQFIVSVAGEFALSCETTTGGIMLLQPVAEEKPTPVAEPVVGQAATTTPRNLGYRIAEPYRPLQP